MNNLNDEFNTFYKREYEVLAEAHFQTAQKITTFFQYALLVLSAPLALFGISSISNKLLGAIFIGVSIVGLLIMGYLAKLRMESLMYARSVNTIRNHFFDMRDLKTELDYISLNEDLSLLTQNKKPPFFDGSQFIFIALIISIIDSFYIGYGCYKWIFVNVINRTILCLVIMFIWLLIHLILYKILAVQSENGSEYFNRILGTDIDGVLNKHEQQFVYKYNELNNGNLKVEQITSIPVHNTGIITELDERKVFLDITYWEDMPVAIDASNNIINIRNKLGYKIYVFTWRDWNIPKFSIKNSTKVWLNKNKIIYNKIFFEHGNYDRPISFFDAKYKTRFYFSSKKKIKFFVEDELIKARKLASICKYVFLMNHKYNQILDNNYKLPYNIIRVDSWNEIYEWIKKLD